MTHGTRDVVVPGPDTAAPTGSRAVLARRGAWALLLAFVLGAACALAASRPLNLLTPEPVLQIRIVESTKPLQSDAYAVQQSFWVRNPNSQPVDVLGAEWDGQLAQVSANNGSRLLPGQGQWFKISADTAQTCRAATAAPTLALILQAAGREDRARVSVDDQLRVSRAVLPCGASRSGARFASLTEGGALDHYLLRVRFDTRTSGPLTVEHFSARFSWGPAQISLVDLEPEYGPVTTLNLAFPAPACGASVPDDAQLILVIDGTAAAPPDSTVDFGGRSHVALGEAFRSAFTSLLEARC